MRRKIRHCECGNPSYYAVARYTGNRACERCLYLDGKATSTHEGITRYELISALRSLGGFATISQLVNYFNLKNSVRNRNTITVSLTHLCKARRVMKRVIDVFVGETVKPVFGKDCCFDDTRQECVYSLIDTTGSSHSKL